MAMLLLLWSVPGVPRGRGRAGRGWRWRACGLSTTSMGICCCRGAVVSPSAWDAGTPPRLCWGRHGGFAQSRGGGDLLLLLPIPPFRRGVDYRAARLVKSISRRSPVPCPIAKYKEFGPKSSSSRSPIRFLISSRPPNRPRGSPYGAERSGIPIPQPSR